MSAEIPPMFTHSIKLEETAKGIRVTVHVYANDRLTALNEALGTYEVMRSMIKDEIDKGVDIALAPMESEKK